MHGQKHELVHSSVTHQYAQLLGTTATNDWCLVAGGSSGGGSIVGGGKRLSKSMGIRGAPSGNEGLWTLQEHTEECKQTGGCHVQLALEGITSNPDGDSCAES